MARSSFALTKSKSFYVKQMKHYLRENWVNLIVLAVVLSLSAASSGIIYQYATDSISSVSSEMLTVTLQDIKNRVSSYLSLSIAVVPAAKGFLASRTIATGNNVTHKNIQDASRMWGYFFEATSSYANSLFYLDHYGNDLGWGAEPDGSSVIITYWPSAFSGFNTYIPVNGAISNISAPHFSLNITLVFPPLDIARTTGKPYWAPVFLLKIGPTDVMPLFTYVEPAYYESDGSFCCVVGTNIYVRSFANVLSSYDIGKDAKIFIADDRGTLIADSQNGLELFLNAADGSALNFEVLPNATQNPDPVLSGAAKYLVKKYGSFGNIPSTDQKLQFKHKGSSQILLVGQFAKDNLRIYIVIVVPYATFFSGITRSRHITISLTIIAVVCGVVRYLFAFRIMARKKNKGNSVVPTHAFDSASTVSSTVSISVTAMNNNTSSREGSSAALVPEEPTKTPVSYFS